MAHKKNVASTSGLFILLFVMLCILGLFYFFATGSKGFVVNRDSSSSVLTDSESPWGERRFVKRSHPVCDGEVHVFDEVFKFIALVSPVVHHDCHHHSQRSLALLNQPQQP